MYVGSKAIRWGKLELWTGVAGVRHVSARELITSTQLIRVNGVCVCAYLCVLSAQYEDFISNVVAAMEEEDDEYG